MVLRNDAGKVFLKVERGSKPRLKVFDDLRKALVTIPYDHTTKWPILREQMAGGLTVVVQRLEQQYKITVEHALDRKPNICVYVNSVANDRNLKTCVRLVNTQLSHVGVAGPNLEITGTIKAQKVTFESTFGALHTNAKLIARHVALNAQHIFIKPEAMYACQMIRMVSRKVQIDGKIYPLEADTSFLNVFIDSALLHIGVDGVIGSFRPGNDKSTAKTPEIIADLLVLRLKGCLANYGRIVSRITMELQVDGSLLSLEDGRIDSAGRGYAALKQIKGIISETSASLPTSSKLSKAIESQNPDTVAQLLEDGVDPNDLIMENAMRCTPKKIAIMKYREIRATEQRNKLRDKITVIQALMVTHDWRRGLIASGTITAKIGRECEDCAQFRAATLELTSLGGAKCEADSIWTSGSVMLCVNNDLVIEGQVKNHAFTVHCGGNISVYQDAIVSQESFAKISCAAFSSSGIWSVGEQIYLEATTASFYANSYLEAEHTDVKLEDHCQHAGTWQTKFLTLSMNGTMLTQHEGKVLVDEAAEVSATAFNCSGVWKVTDSVQIHLKESANFSPSSVVSSNLLKLVNGGCCTFAGHVTSEHLLAYVRNDLITAASGRVVVGVGGTVAAGAFRNDASWLSECNLHLHVACFQQSEDAIVYAKDRLNLFVYDNSVEGNQGRIVANYCTVRVNRQARFDGYIRVNQIEVSLPYSSESQFIVGGQIEVLFGPLILKGRSEFSASQAITVPHMHPGFVLEGQLKAEAVIAPLLAIQFATTSYALLSGMSSVSDAPYKAMLSAGAIHTTRASFIDSASADSGPEGIVCATTWIHEGQFRFRGAAAYIVAGSFVNRGRLTNEGRLHNHMKSACVSVANRFENESVFSADKIQITGDGELENKNRIFATEAMHIRLSNFSNESGHMQSEDIKLLSAGKEWTKINGRIDAKKNLDISASKLSVELKDFDFRRQMRITARAQLRVNNEVLDRQAKISLSARDAIIFDAKVVCDAVELTLGEAYETEVIVSERSTLEANQLLVSGKCKFLTVVADGLIRCDSMIFDDAIRNVRIVGKGTLISRNTINFNGKTASLLLAEMQALEVLGTAIRLSPAIHLKLTQPENSSSTTIYADSCTVEGRVLTCGKLNLKSSNGVVRIDGELIGTTLMSELSAEGNDVILSGNVSNFEFFEIYARHRIEYCDTALISNTRNIAMEAEFIALDGKLTHFDSVIATAEEVIVEGTLSNDHSGNASLFGKTIRFEGNAEGLLRFEFSSRHDTYLSGVLCNVERLSVDAKWLICSAKITAATVVDLAAYSSVLGGSITCSSISVNVLGALFLHSSLQAQSCILNGAFIFAFCENAPTTSIPHWSDVSALLYATDNAFNVADADKICLKLFFSSKHPEAEANRHWGTAIDLFEDAFQGATVNGDHMLSVLEYSEQLHSSAYSFPISSELCKRIRDLVSRFQIEHVSVFNCFKMLETIRQCALQLNYCEDWEEDWPCPGFKAEGLCETVKQLRVRLLKYTLQSPQSSVDDYGYASRSSSEDTDDKLSARDRDSPLSPSISITKCEDGSRTQLANITCDQIEEEINQSSQFLSVPSRLCFSKEESVPASEERETLRDGSETGFVLNGEQKVPIVFIDFNRFDFVASKPRFEMPRHPSSTVDLVLKKIKVKEAMSNLDLRSFGSQSSLASFDTAECATPQRLLRSPLRRSLIPRSSFRQPANVAV